MLIANTDIEAKQLINLYDADAGRVEVVHPGVDLDVFRPAGHGGRAAPPRAAGRRARAAVRRPDPAAQGARRAAARGGRAARAATRSCAPGWSCPSSAARPASGLEHPESLADLADALGLADVVRFVPPVAQAELADWYAAATLVAVPSYNESFGLVAVEAQAAGTPVVAAAVGGLTTVVARRRQRPAGRGPRPARLGRRAAPDRRRRRPARAGSGRARSRRRAQFSWERTAERTLEVYRRRPRR